MLIDNFNTLNSLSKIPSIKIESANDLALKEQTDSFESLILKDLLDKSLETKDSIFPEAVGSDIYKSMYHDMLSKELSGGFGYSELLFNFLKENSKS